MLSFPSFLRRPRGVLVVAILLLLGLGAGAGFFRYAARDVAEGVLGELAARPSVPAEQLELWLRYGEPQIQNRLMLLRYSAGLPALVTHVSEPDGPGQPPRIHGVDLAGPRPALVVRRDLRVEVRLGAPQLLVEGRLEGEAADRVPKAGPGTGPEAGRAFAQGVLEWALEPLAEALPRDIEGAELAIVIEAEPRAPWQPGRLESAPAKAPRSPLVALVVTLATLLTLFLALILAARRGRRVARPGAQGAVGARVEGTPQARRPSAGAGEALRPRGP